MALYGYKAYRSPDAEVTGTVAADTPRHARELLRESGLVPCEVRPQKQTGRRTLFCRRSSLKTLALFRELSTLLSVGVPLLSALDSIIRQHRGVFRGVLLSLKEQVSSGSSLADALRAHRTVFDELSVSLVDVGERTGTLDEVLHRLSVFKERSGELRGRIGNALIYPAIVLVMAGLIAVLLMTFVVPSILGPLVEAGKRLPAITRTVKGVSDVLVHGWWALGIAGVVLTLVSAIVLRTTRAQVLLHRTVLRLPVLGTLVQKQIVVRLAIVLSALLRSGIVFVKALEVARGSVRNRVVHDALLDCESAILAGEDIAAALEGTGAFPPTVVQVFAVGQESGELERMLDRLATDYDRDVQSQSQRLASLLEPVMIFLLALVVAAIAFATILPILEAGHVL